VRHSVRNVFHPPGGPEERLRRLHTVRKALPGIRIEMLSAGHPLFDSSSPDGPGRRLVATAVFEPGQWLGQYTGHARPPASTDGRSQYVLSMPSGFAAATAATAAKGRAARGSARDIPMHVIDAAAVGNEMRFINDPRGGVGTRPNVKFQPAVWLNGRFLDLDEKTDELDGHSEPELVMGVRAICRISPGEEILVDYGNDYFRV